MTKIGRNQPCPCGSGNKYKHCCLPALREGRAPAPPMEPLQFSLQREVERIQAAAGGQEVTFIETGVFILFADRRGDAWLLEVVESDAVKVAEQGKPLAIELEENSETIAVNWSHTFRLQDKQLVLTSYEDNTSMELAGAPTQQIHAAIRRIGKRYTPEVLEMIHVNEQGAL